jgi:hypothetical protein
MVKTMRESETHTNRKDEKMKADLATRFIDTANEMDFEVELYDEGHGYSGRGMYGEGTTAITLDSSEHFMRVLVAVAFRMGQDDPDSDGIETDELMQLRTDHLGTSTVVY